MWPFEEPEADPEALALYEEAVEELRHRPDGPQDERQWADLGRQLNRLASLRADAGQTDAAIESFDEAIAIWERLDRDKARFVSRMRRALVYARDGQPGRANDEIEALIERAQSDPIFRPYFDTLALYRAAILTAAGEPERAAEDLERAIAVRSARKPGSEAELVAWKRQLATDG